MSQLVDHIADLTGFRDRDVLDVTLVGAMKDLLRPHSVAIYRRVGDVGDEHWLTRARLTAHEVVATSDPGWTELDVLPTLGQFPHRQRAMLSQQVVQVADSQPCLTVFPVATDRDVVGVLEIESHDPLSAESLRLVTGILRVYRNFQGLLDYSERDTLTGLLNRKTFDEAFLKASAEQQNVAAGANQGDRRAAANAANTWLGVIDIDHFKRVNDNFGHLIGDEVLLLLSRLMRASFRFHDRLYRFGGEEFVVLMRCEAASDAAHAFERLRSNTEAYAFPQVGHITVSIGFTALRLGDTPSGAFERADKAVYYAKEHGRNRVCSHAELLAMGELVEDDDKTGDVELF
jgi:diguanylate cyclase (GGDEF)-like protein